MEPLKMPQLIFDTDMDTDCDDAGAFAMIAHAVQQGRAQLLGVIADVVNPYAAACCEALCRHYSLNCPIGTIYAHEYPENETDRCTAYRAHSAEMGVRQYNPLFAQSVGKTDRDGGLSVTLLGRSHCRYQNQFCFARSVYCGKFGLIFSIKF